MLADLLGVSVRIVRRWQAVGLLLPTTEVMQLPYFDYASLTIAKQLSRWTQQGLSVHAVRSQLQAFQDRVGDSEADLHRLIEQLSIQAEGKQLVLRHGDQLLEATGQFRLAFEEVEAEDHSSPTVRFQPPQAAAHRPPQASGSPMDLAAMVDAAMVAEDSGDFETAIDWYRAALSAHGPNADICFQVAELLYRQGDVSGARERYFVALELNPSLVEARANLGCVLAECGQLELAIAAFEGTLDQYADYADVHFHLARALDEAGNAMQAAEHWLRFLELAPESPWADEARERLSLAAPILDI